MIVAVSTVQAFQGNPSERQVSFPVGEWVTYDTAHSSQGGWVWVKLASNGSSGWCPQTYLTAPETGPMAPPPASTAPIAASPAVNDQKWIQDADDAFFGSITGGSAASRPSQSSGEAPFAVATPVATTAGAGASGPVNRVKGAIQNLGNNMQQGAQAAGTAVSNGAQVAGAYATKAFFEVKEGVQDLKQKQQTISNKPRGQRSAGEQRIIDVGNYAARGAVANGIYHGIMSGGKPKSAARGAVRGGVHGGAWGAVARWKPFG